MSHLSRTADKPRGKLLWAFIASLALVQVVALWLLCSHQVRTAAVRNAGLQVERTAMADCLRQVPDATRNSCARRITGNSNAADVMPASEPADRRAARMSTALPVNFTFR